MGTHQLKDLRPEHVQKAINDKIGNDQSLYRSAQYMKSVLHGALEQAVKNGIIPRNVCVAVSLPPKRKQEFIPWTTEQANAFLTNVQDSRLFPLYLTAWGSGCRRSELLGLKWSDIDLKNGCIHVRRSIVQVDGVFIEDAPKTHKSARKIVMPEGVLTEISTWKKRQAAEKIAFPGEYNPDDFVFTNEIGQLYRPDYITHAFNKAIKKAGLPPIRFHDLRHPYVKPALKNNFASYRHPLLSDEGIFCILSLIVIGDYRRMPR